MTMQDQPFPAALRTPTPQRPLSLLFVCLGNICRSPLAKGIFLHQARTRGVLDRFVIDSCGTGHWHAGGPADPRTIAVAIQNGVRFDHVARQVDPDADFARFDLLLAMDRKNHRDLLAMGASPSRVVLFRSFDATLAHESPRGHADHLDVPDPYHGGDGGFQVVYDMLWRASEGLLARTT